jgi:predicted RNase H-like HicB family nuclease
MRYTVNLEEMEGRWIAHVQQLPGCFASAYGRETVQAQVPAAIQAYFEWTRSNGEVHPYENEAFEIEVNEIVREWPNPSEPEYEVNAFFASDAEPLEANDIRQALKLFDWIDIALDAALNDLSESDLAHTVEDDWSIRHIVLHIGGSQWWYLERLDREPCPREQVPEEPFARLELVRTHLRDVLPELEGDTHIAFRGAELWSPRKLLRRSLWHARDHVQHILQFRARLRT